MHSDESTDQTESGLKNVGKSLLTARQSAGLSAVELADSLHMGHEQLDALEKGDRDRLPEPVFIKAMTRRVAAKLQIDSDPLIRELSIALTAKDAASQKKGSPKPQRSTSHPSPSTSPPRLTNISAFWKTTATIAVLAGIGVVSAFAFSKQQQSPSRTLATEATSRPVPLIESEQVVPTERPMSENLGSKPSTLTITSREPSWLEVRNVERETVYKGMLDEEKRLTVNPGDEIYAGRPDLVLFSDGDKPPQPLGDISDVRWHKITPEP